MLLLLLLSQQGADSFADRLRIARKASGLTQQEVAGKVGIKQSTLSGLEKGASLSSTFTPKLAHVYGVNARWLATGEGAPVAGEAPNVSPGPDIQGSVPLISWVRAGELCESPEGLNPADASDWFDCPVKHGPRTFCLRVDGDSMDDGTSDGYREGEIIFVDPDADPMPGRDVVVRSPENKTTFKRLKEDSEGRYLLALNGKKIVRVPEGTHYCGVVIFSGVRR